MSNTVKIKNKKKSKKVVVEEPVGPGDDADLDAIAERVRKAYAEEEEIQAKMLEIATVHIDAHDASIKYWEERIEKAQKEIETARIIFPGCWEGKLLWLERVAQMWNLDVIRSNEYDDGVMHLYWADVDGNVMMKDGEEQTPELRVESLGDLKSLKLLVVEAKNPG